MVKDIAEKISEMIKENMKNLNEKEVDDLIENIVKSKNIFIVGAGRSGLVGKAFAMRLMHLGFNVYVVGETITPAINPEDLLIAISGSGKTTFTVGAVKTAKKIGVRVVGITSYENSEMGKLCDKIVKIPGREVIKRSPDYFSSQLTGNYQPLTPLGSLFELSTMVFLDSVIAKLMRKLNKKEDYLRKRHTNLQ